MHSLLGAMTEHAVAGDLAGMLDGQTYMAVKYEVEAERTFPAVTIVATDQATGETRRFFATVCEMT